MDNIKEITFLISITGRSNALKEMSVNLNELSEQARLVAEKTQSMDFRDGDDACLFVRSKRSWEEIARDEWMENEKLAKSLGLSYRNHNGNVSFDEYIGDIRRVFDQEYLDRTIRIDWKFSPLGVNESTVDYFERTAKSINQIGGYVE